MRIDIAFGQINARNRVAHVARTTLRCIQQARLPRARSPRSAKPVAEYPRLSWESR